LPFPLDQRFVIAGWKLLFLRRGSYQPDPAKSAEWNRGAYLVEGLAHCGACHTPRNALGAERANAAFAGGEVDDWSAYAINAQSPAPVPWKAEALFSYLRNGWHRDHGAARGPMAEVVGNLADVPDADIRAIATYMADVSGAPSPDRNRSAEEVLAQVKPSAATATADTPGAAIYAAACATCHENGRALPFGGVRLALSTALSSPDPRNAANIVLAGIRPVEGERSAIMPGFAGSMSDAQLTALLNDLRARFSHQPAWSGLEKTIADARRAQTAMLQTSPGPSSAPAEASQRDKP
jgi:mono/diheme cytochrome c family protein